MKFFILFAPTFFLLNNFAIAKIITKEIDYKVGKKSFKGYLAYRETKEAPRPGILIVHEWWGQTEYPRMRARMLAEEGYTALAVDMYGDRKIATHPKDANKFSSQVRENMPEAMERFKAAMDLLKKQSTVDRDHIGAIGYCFGGSIVLEMATRGLDLKAVASFHGGLKGLSTPNKGQVKASILVANGAQDKMISAEDIKSFKSDMKKAKVQFKFINYKDALHGFTNPEATGKGKQYSIPLAYNKEADQKSWKEMLSLFDRVF